MEARTRMISFRLSEEEFERFRMYCEARGIRSISEMARTAIQRMIEQSGGRPESLEEQVVRLAARIEGLSQEVKELRDGGRLQGDDEEQLASSAGQG